MLDLSDCPCVGGTLDRLIQPAVLVALTNGPMHGYRLAEEIGQMPGFAGHKPDVSGIYRILKAMQKKGLVVGAWDVSESGPARKAYEITLAGRQCLAQWAKTLESYRDEITALLEAARRAARHVLPLVDLGSRNRQPEGTRP